MKYIVEHMEEEVYEWCQLEYSHMSQVVGKDNLLFTKVPQEHIKDMPENVSKELCSQKDILDLGLPFDRICLLDQESDKVLAPEDVSEFDYVLFGGILGDEDTEAIDCIVKDRTIELRKLGFKSRNLGKEQMTTDHAVLTTKLILEDKIKFNDIQFADNPEIKFNKNESTIMPFRYVKDAQGEPRIAPGMKALLKKQTLEF
ncbi:DUF431-domain-containing protein [Neoconidiobolus thromboides FSU 785]|nr:DUF431-domain-containing protein [Neoconidiobolus thromboides FSU 785]